MGSEWCSFFLSFPRSDGASEEAAILVAWEFTLPWFVTDWMDKEKGNTADVQERRRQKRIPFVSKRRLSLLFAKVCGV